MDFSIVQTIYSSSSRINEASLYLRSKTTCQNNEEIANVTEIERNVSFFAKRRRVMLNVNWFSKYYLSETFVGTKIPVIDDEYEKPKKERLHNSLEAHCQPFEFARRSNCLLFHRVFPVSRSKGGKKVIKLTVRKMFVENLNAEIIELGEFLGKKNTDTEH